jgi:hypothetical protein
MWLYDVFMESHSADLKRICRAVSLSTMIMGLPQHGHGQVMWDGVVASCAEQPRPCERVTAERQWSGRSAGLDRV